MQNLFGKYLSHVKYEFPLVWSQVMEVNAIKLTIVDPEWAYAFFKYHPQKNKLWNDNKYCVLTTIWLEKEHTWSVSNTLI